MDEQNLWLMDLPTTQEEYQRRIQLARREGFRRGADWRSGLTLTRYANLCTTGDYDNEARRRYQIKKKVPRVLSDEGGASWKVESGEIFVKYALVGWTKAYRVDLTPDRVSMWADLLANPFDEVSE